MEKKIIYISNNHREPWGLLRYQHGEPNDPATFNFKTLNEMISHDVRRGLIYDYEVRIEAGTYYNFSYTWPFLHDAKVSFVPYGDGEVILNGGKKIEGFIETVVNGVKAFMTEIPTVKTGEWNFTDLYVNKKPCKHPVFPQNGEKFRIAGIPAHDVADSNNQDCFIVSEEDRHYFESLTNITDASVQILHYWISEIFPITVYDKETGVCHFSVKSKMAMQDDVVGGFAKYRISNVFEGLKNPGEFYLNRKTGILYYIPREGETVDNILVEAPVQHRLLTLHGTKEHPIQNISFHNITFENTTYNANYERYPVRLASYSQAANNCDGGISLEYAKNVEFDHCKIRNIGDYGIELLKGCSYDVLDHCEISGCGAGGVKIYGGDANSELSDRATRIRVENCHIHDCTLTDYSAIGIFLGHGSSCRLAHNEIHNLKYTGISVGWVWGMMPSSSDNNIVEYNHIYNCGDGDLSDMGGIYLLGPQGGTEIRGNYIHDIHRANYGGQGIYLDEGSTNVVVEKNIIEKCDSTCLFIHYGRENIIRYNIIGASKDNDGCIGFGAGVETNFMNIMKNVIYAERNYVYKGCYNFDFSQKWLISDANFIYSDMSKPLINTRHYEKDNETWEQWTSYGFDVFSQYLPLKEEFPHESPKELLKFGFPDDVTIEKAGIDK